MTYTSLSPTSFGPINRLRSPDGQAHVMWLREFGATRRAERRARRTRRRQHLRLRLVG